MILVSVVTFFRWAISPGGNWPPELTGRKLRNFMGIESKGKMNWLKEVDRGSQ